MRFKTVYLSWKMHILFESRGWKTQLQIKKGAPMLKRSVMSELQEWKKNKTKQALLIMGARQVGKTTAVREFARDNYESVAEVNFYANGNAAAVLSAATDLNDLLFRLSIISDAEMIPGKTLIFLDEVQECPDMLTWVKFLAGDKGFDVILSGSLLGLDAFANARSLPVGFLNVASMYPLTLMEYCWSYASGEQLWSRMEECILSKTQIPDFIHASLMKRFREYLLIGGMPDAVAAFRENPQIVPVRRIQKSIVELYEADIVKYVHNPVEARQIKMAYDAIPSQLNSPTKRFKYARLGKNLRFANLEIAFDWLTSAGIAIEATRVGDPVFPLTLTEDRGSFKLFMNDLGLMASRIMSNVPLEVIEGRDSINYGSLFEAYVAQELLASGVTPHYFSSKKRGEVDFVIENSEKGLTRLIEVKSGKDYKRHSALSGLIENGCAKLPVVLYDGNVRVAEDRVYLPIYAASLISRL